jgi:hypothetical protein
MRGSLATRLLGLTCVPAALALGCASPELKAGFNPDPSAVISTVTIAPASITIPQGTTITFIYYARTVGGDSLVPRLDWVANGGALGPDGEYTGTQVGTFRVIGTNHTAPQVGDTVSVTVTPSAAVDSVTVAPELVTVLPGGTYTFTADAYLADGSIAPAAADWNASGGTITAAGQFTAGTATGTFRVDATDPATHNLLDTATVIVSQTLPTLQAVVVTPAAGTIPSGGTLQFVAKGNYSDGSALPVAVTWTASAGTITTGGLYTAGQTAGTYRVIGRNTASGLADTSLVTVTGTLASIDLSPATASLQFGGTQQFSATGKLTSGRAGGPSRRAGSIPPATPRASIG